MQTEESLPNSSLAVASLVAGILGITFIPILGSLVALITGFMARKEIASNPDTLGGDGLALAGVILGGLGILLGIMACCLLLVGLFLPAAILLPVIRETTLLPILVRFPL